MNGPGNPKIIYTITEFCRVTGFDRKRVYNAVNSGEIPSFKLGTRIYIPVDVVDRMVERRISEIRHSHDAESGAE